MDVLSNCFSIHFVFDHRMYKVYYVQFAIRSYCDWFFSHSNIWLNFSCAKHMHGNLSELSKWKWEIDFLSRWTNIKWKLILESCKIFKALIFKYLFAMFKPIPFIGNLIKCKSTPIKCLLSSCFPNWKCYRILAVENIKYQRFHFTNLELHSFRIHRN